MTTTTVETSWEQASKWRVAPEGMSALHCVFCSTPEQPAHFTIADEKKMWAGETGLLRCPSCKRLQHESECRMSVRADNAHLMDAEGIKRATWYHATTRSDWMGDLEFSAEHWRREWDTEAAAEIPEGSDMMATVHVGTLDAALERASDMDKESERKIETWYIYEVCLSEDAEVNPYILRDDNEDAPDTVYGCKGNYIPSANPYVNRYESVGSISLLVNPRHLRILNRTTV